MSSFRWESTSPAVVSYSFTNFAVSFPMVCGSAYFAPSSPASFVILDFTVSVPSWLCVGYRHHDLVQRLTRSRRVSGWLSSSDSQIWYVYVPGFV